MTDKEQDNWLSNPTDYETYLNPNNEEPDMDIDYDRWKDKQLLKGEDDD